MLVFKNMREAIGLLDSGVGGLTVAREIMKALPQEKIVYYGDTLHLPYGPRLKEEVKGFVFEIIDFFIQVKRVKAVVLACNTATSFALEEAQAHYKLPIFGTLSGACVKAIEVSRKGKIGVIGTEGTINSQMYQQTLLELNPNLEVFSAACPRFVELVEKGEFSGAEVETVAHKYLDGLRKVGVDVLILGCTHFPYLSPVIQKIMGPNVVLVNPAIELAREVKASFGLEDINENEGDERSLNQHEFWVSDQSRISELFLREGSAYLGLPSLRFQEKNIFKGEENVR